MALRLEDVLGEIKGFLDVALTELEGIDIDIAGKEIDHVREYSHESVCFRNGESRAEVLPCQ